jgi:AcrR family transcriptional regulator
MTETANPARAKILDAASRAFAEEGFAGARVDEIARRAGVNKAMLYYHVGDKRALYGEVLKRNFGRIEKALEENLPDEGSAADRLRAVITIVERAIASNPEPVMTHLTLIGALLMLNVVSPLRERVADLGSTIDVPGADAGASSFLGDLLLHGIAAPRSGEST